MGVKGGEVEGEESCGKGEGELRKGEREGRDLVVEWGKGEWGEESCRRGRGRKAAGWGWGGELRKGEGKEGCRMGSGGELQKGDHLTPSSFTQVRYKGVVR